MANLILSDTQLAFVEDAIITAAYPNGNTYLRLFTNAYTFIRTTAVGDLVECTLSGYTPQLVNFPASTLDSGNHWAYTYSAVCVFTTSDPVGVNVYGAYILNPNNGLLLAGYNFPGPVTFNNTTPIVAQVQHTYESKYS